MSRRPSHLDSLSVTIVAATLTFVGWGTLLLSEPTFAWGSAITPAQSLVLAVLIALATSLVAGLTFLVFGNRGWTVRGSLIATLAIFALTPVTYEQLLRVADDRFEVTESLVTSKIDYFCVQNFVMNTCVTVINQCPRCAGQLEPGRRTLAHRRIQAVADQLNAARVKHEVDLFERKPAAAK